MSQTETQAVPTAKAADPLDALEKEAEAARAAGNHPAARAAYHALLAAGAKGPHFPLRLARACHALKDHPGMEEALASLRARPETPPVLLATGEVLQLLGRHDEAVEVLRARQAAAPLPPQGWRLLARALRAAGREREALTALQEARALHPDALGLAIEALRLEVRLHPDSLDSSELDRLVAAHPEAEAAQALRVDLLTRLHRPEAEAAARDFLAAFPDSAQARAACAAQAARAGKHAEAAAHYRHLLQAGSHSPWHALHLARACEALKDQAGLEEALSHLQAMPDTAQARRIGAEILRLLGRHEAAVAALQAAAELEPLPANGWRLLIDSLQKSARPEAAAAAARQACAAFPEAVPLRLKRLELRALLPGYNPVIAAGAAAALVAMHGERPDVHLTRLRVLKAAGDSEGARKAAANFLEALPEDRRARLECARLAFAAGDEEEALRHYRVLREREPERSEHLVQIARCCDRLEDMTGVVDSLIALETLPQDAARERAIAQVLQLMQLHEEAVEPLQRARALDPAAWPVWQQLATLLTRLGRAPEAEALLAELPLDLRDTPQAAMLCSRVAWALGDSETAIAELQGLGEAHSFASRQLLASHLTETGRLEEAEAELDALAPANPRERAQIHRARADIARWRYDAAAMLAHCEAALAEQPDDAATLMRMAQAHLLRLDPQACLDSMKRVKELRVRRDDAAARPRQSIQGQIANEMMLDGATTARLAELVARDDEAALSAIAEQAGAARTTGPALALLIAARRNGLLEPDDSTTAPAGEDSTPAVIPPIIHQYWEGTMPTDVAAAIERMQRLNPWAEHRLYDRRSAPELLKAHGYTETARAFRLAHHAAERADIFRLAVLALEGGFYVDIDDFCLRSLAPLAAPGVTFICRQEQQGTTGNNFIAATPGHPIVTDALEEVVEETLNAASESIWLRSGPGLLTRSSARHMARVGPKHFARGHRIMTTGALSRSLAINRPLSYKLDKRNWARAEREGDHLSIRELYTARRNAAAAA